MTINEPAGKFEIEKFPFSPLMAVPIITPFERVTIIRDPAIPSPLSTLMTSPINVAGSVPNLIVVNVCSLARTIADTVLEANPGAVTFTK